MEENEKIPFVLMLYEQNSQGKEFKCDFPKQFINEFGNSNQEQIKIGYFFIMGRPYDVKTLKEALKAMNG